jgi:hypothetical protein
MPYSGKNCFLMYVDVLERRNERRENVKCGTVLYTEERDVSGFKCP